MDTVSTISDVSFDRGRFLTVVEGIHQRFRGAIYPSVQPRLLAHVAAAMIPSPTLGTY